MQLPSEASLKRLKTGLEVLVLLMLVPLLIYHLINGHHRRLAEHAASNLP